MKRLCIVRDSIYLEHKTQAFHPESHHRLEALYDLLDETDMRERYRLLKPRKATRKEIEYIHSPAYYDRVEATSHLGQTYLDPDTVTSPRSFEAALYAAGGVLAGIDSLFSSSADSVFALVRPPGHHAERDHGMGFCLFNNIAIGAAYAIEQHTIERVLIVDWDLHHGNGTQHSFYTDPRVLYFSTHQYPYYPGSGAVNEIGHGDGEGFTVNVPLTAGKGDEEYIRIFNKILVPIAHQYNPQLVLVSAGFDTYAGDPLGGMMLSPSGFGTLTELVAAIALRYAGGKLLLSLEGGYDLRGLRECVKGVINTLVDGAESTILDPDRDREGSGALDEYIEQVLAVQRKFWRCF
jgi:acetoin utilization deacetylase AcuC-like enzyme